MRLTKYIVEKVAPGQLHTPHPRELFSGYAYTNDMSTRGQIILAAFLLASCRMGLDSSTHLSLVSSQQRWEEYSVAQTLPSTHSIEHEAWKSPLESNPGIRNESMRLLTRETPERSSGF